jgi:hypothetical protein
MRNQMIRVGADDIAVEIIDFLPGGAISAGDVGQVIARSDDIADVAIPVARSFAGGG